MPGTCMWWNACEAATCDAMRCDAHHIVHRATYTLRGRDGAKLLEEERQAPAGDPSIKRKKDELQAKIAALVKDKEYAQKDIELIQKG